MASVVKCNILSMFCKQNILGQVFFLSFFFTFFFTRKSVWCKLKSDTSHISLISVDLTIIYSVHRRWRQRMLFVITSIIYVWSLVDTNNNQEYQTYLTVIALDLKLEVVLCNLFDFSKIHSKMVRFIISFVTNLYN